MLGDLWKSFNKVALDPWGRPILTVWCATMLVLTAGVAFAVVFGDVGTSSAQAYDIVSSAVPPAAH